MERHITLPLTREEARTIKSGEQLLLSGVIYTARDAAHKRLCELVEKGEPLPFDVKNATIYYVGPTPAKPGQVIGSAGPTTSYRMDAYSPTLIREGETGMIGKGKMCIRDRLCPPRQAARRICALLMNTLRESNAAAAWKSER